MVDPKAAKFINSLVKSLQMLCHGCMDFNHNIEIIGHINLRIDNSQKFDYIVNEQVSKQGDDSTYFQSNSYHSLPPPKSSREKEKHQASSRSDDGSSIAESATNHHRLDSAAVVGSRVQIDLSGPISVSHEVESSPEHRFSISSNASNGGRRPSHSRDFSVDSEQNRLHDPLISFEDHAHNHSCSSGAAVRDKEGSERPASNSSSSERTDISSVFLGKDIEKRQQDCEGVVGQDGSIIVKAEPDDAAVEAAMEEEAEQQEHELLGIPSVSSVLPMAHQSALVANATHPSHAMFAAATLGHHGMFDSNLGAQDDSDVGRQSYVQEAFMQQILSAQKPTHLSHPGARFSVPGGMAMAGAAAAAFGTMGVGAFAPQYPLAFHRLAQTYMHAIWRQGLYHHSSASSPSSSSSSATSATVSLQAWNTTASAPCGPFPAVSQSGASTSGERTSKRTMTPAERMREYREKLKRNPEVYQRYKQMNALRSRLARMRRSQEQVQKDREKARIRNLRYRSRLPDGMDLMAFAAETSALDFSNAGPATPPSASDTERSLAPSSPSSDWEPPVSFGDPPTS